MSVRLFGRELAAGRGVELRAADESAGPVEILIYDVIGKYFDWASGKEAGISAAQLVQDLATLKGRDLTVRINSAGGIVHEGVAIYNALKRHDAPVSVAVDGNASSIASLIAMAGTEIAMAENATMMIHSAWVYAAGNARDLRQLADVLDRLDEALQVTYARRTGQPDEQVKSWMLAETWMTAKEALDRGFATKIVDGTKEIAASAKLDPSMFRALDPTQLKAVAIEGVDIEERRQRTALARARLRVLKAATSD